ncbi:MAG: GNAT family N-acetyltransferase [Xenococcaceae cyanobacterium MO_188.B32]|nr:GNAT family N-acetyltransferase [Xenococcaceae cyanobacterium MO_188.B32]
MAESTKILVREALVREDSLIAQHFYQLWLDNGVTAEQICTDWLEITLQFIDRARQELAYQAFVAERDGEIFGSAGGQLFAGLYPQPFVSEYRKYGYVWNVYVESSYRRQGIGDRLTKRTIDYLKSLGCTRILLDASPFGKPLYESMGFYAGNEMRLDLL